MAQERNEERSFGPAGQRRRAELMQAAVRLAARNGFAKTRVSDVVGEVGVGQGVFYWYFESKDALFAEVFADTTRRLRIFQGGFIADEPDPVSRVAKGILATFEFIGHNRHTFALLDHASAQARWRRHRQQVARVHTDDVVVHLEEAMGEGSVRRTRPDVLAEGIRGVVDRLARTYLGTDGMDVDALAQEAIDFCLAGLTGGRSLDVAELRRGIDVPPALERIRDRVGAGLDGPDEP